MELQLPIGNGSGHLTADNRMVMALQLRARGDLDAAADLISQALEVAPGWAEARFALAETLTQLGRADAARAAFEHYLAIDPSDSMGAAAHLFQLRGGGPPPDLSPAYVQRLFDQYAPTFEKSLLEGLGYSAPSQICAALRTAQPGRRFAYALDLGCGTGLMGQAIRTDVDLLEGCDLSPKMVAAAMRKGIYDRLWVADLTAALVRLAGNPGELCDLILAADVLIYKRDLGPVLAAATNVARPGGVLAFTLQRCEDADIALGLDQRYWHGRGYVLRIATETGWTPLYVGDAASRKDKGMDVPGLLILLQK
ncbi:MAG: methyltransferase [Rhodobacteraceae bacterium]|nr:methyltransferase [Paracoccaceae bacterium]